MHKPWIADTCGSLTTFTSALRHAPSVRQRLDPALDPAVFKPTPERPCAKPSNRVIGFCYAKAIHQATQQLLNSLEAL
jgi:hypothetical protein